LQPGIARLCCVLTVTKSIKCNTYDTCTYVLEKEFENLRIFIINNRKTESFGGSHYILHVTVLLGEETGD
jgi:hypothetical protein